MKKRSYLVLIAILTVVMCLTMAFGTTAFAVDENSEEHVEQDIHLNVEDSNITTGNSESNETATDQKTSGLETEGDVNVAKKTESGATSEIKDSTDSVSKETKDETAQKKEISSDQDNDPENVQKTPVSPEQQEKKDAAKELVEEQDSKEGEGIEVKKQNTSSDVKVVEEETEGDEEKKDGTALKEDAGTRDADEEDGEDAVNGDSKKTEDGTGANPNNNNGNITDGGEQPTVVEKINKVDLTEAAKDANEGVENDAIESSFDYSITFTTGDRSTEVKGGQENSLSEILAGLGYDITPETLIEVDQESVDTDVINVTETVNGYVLTDNGVFDRASKNLVVYVNGQRVEIEVEDPIYVNGASKDVTDGKIDAATLEGYFKTTTDANIKLGEAIEVTGNQTITINTGAHDLFLATFELKDSRTGTTDALFTIENGATLNVYGGADKTTAGEGKITSDIASLFNVKAGGTLNIISGNITASGTSDNYSNPFSAISVAGGTANISGGSVNASGNQTDKNIQEYVSAIKLTNNGTVNISGGSITGTGAYQGFGIYVNSGEVMVSGGTLTGKAERNNGYGIFTKGTVKIFGGTITGTSTSSEGYGIKQKSDGTVKVFSGLISGSTKALNSVTASNVTGGYFSSADCLPDSKTEVNLTVNGITYKYKVGNVAKIGTKEYATIVAAITEASTKETTIVLIDDSIENITIAAGQKITLDLNGHVIKAKLTEGDNCGVVIVDKAAELTLKDSNPTAEHYYSYSSTNAWTWLINPTEDQKNAAVTVENISAETAENTVIKVLGGAITGGSNTAMKNIGEGGHDNLGDNGGGAIQLYGKCTLKSGNLIGNYAQYDGGAVNVQYKDAVFEMTGGSILGNMAQMGGGIFVYFGKASMTGGTVAYNVLTRTPNCGGGVAIHGSGSNNASFTMTGGTITGNKAIVSGGGVWVNTSNTSITLGGTAQITGNTVNGKANNLYLTSGKTVTVATGDDAPKSGMSVGVTLASGYGKVSSNSGDSAKYFVSDNVSYVAVKNTTGDYVKLISVGSSKAAIVETGALYASVQLAIKDANGKTVRMTANSTENITIAENTTITLDLNGKVLTGTGNGSVIKVNQNAALTLNDSNPTAEHYFKVGSDGLWVLDTSGTTPASYTAYDNLTARPAENAVIEVTGGAITGGVAVNGGGVYNTGNLTINGGNIIGNHAKGSKSTNGGGVYSCNNANLTMTGGRIIGNATLFTTSTYDTSLNCTGGGVAVHSGTFNFSGGTVSFNASQAGGGIRIGCGQTSATAAILNMSGTASINYNLSNANGSAVQVNGTNSGTYNVLFNMTDGTITGNTFIAPYSVDGGFDAGVQVYQGTFTMTGGVITGNVGDIDKNIAAVAVRYQGKINLGGTAQITGNTGSNLYLANSKTVTVLDGDNELKTGANIGVTTQTEAVKGKAVDVTSNGTAADMQYFHSDKTNNTAGDKIEVIYELNSDNTASVVRFAIPVAQIGEDTDAMQYSTVQKAVLAAADNTETTIKMIANSTENITVAAGKNITLDLNDCTLTATGTAITLTSGSFTLTDTGTNKTGTIKANDSVSVPASGIYVNSNNQSDLEINVNGGTIDCSSSNDGKTAFGIEVNSNSVPRNLTVKVSDNAEIISTSNSSNAFGLNLSASNELTVNISDNAKITATSSGSTKSGTGILAQKAGKINVTVSGNAEITGTSSDNSGSGTGIYAQISSNIIVTVGDNAKITGTGADSGSYGIEVSCSNFQNSEIAVSGGKIKGSTGDLYAHLAGYTSELRTGYSVTGGIFSKDPTRYLDTGHAAAANTDPETSAAYPFAISENVICNDGSHGYVSVQKAVDYIGQGTSASDVKSGTVVMVAYSKENDVVIKQYQDITLDLNGNALYSDVDDSTVVRVEGGTFTLIDSAENGRITHVSEKSGCGVYVDTGAVFNMTDGMITANNATIGGGVCVYGTFNMTGGTIIGNNATQNGGGVCVYGTFNMTGGMIKDNNAVQNGGGVYVDTTGTMTVGGTAQIFNNILNGTTANNLYLNGKTVAVGTGDNALKTGANIGVTTTTEPVKGTAVDVTSNGTAADMQYFHSDKTTNSKSETIEVIYEWNDETGSAKAEVVRLAVPVAQIGSMKYSKVQKAVDSITVTTDTDITMIADSTEDVVITDENVNLKLNGKTLTGSVTVNGGSLDLPEAGTVTGDVAVNGTGKLTVSNGTVTGNVTGSESATVTVSGGTVSGDLTGNDNAALIISNGTVGGTVMSSGKELTISGGTFNGDVAALGASKLTITKGTTDEGAKFNGNVACISNEAPTVTGGQFKNDPSDLLDKDHTAVKKDGASYYTISNDPNDIFATYTDDNGKEHSFNTVQQAIDYLSKYPQQDLSKPATIKLTRSTDENLTVGENQNIKIDLNGNDIKAKYNTKPVITSSGTLTVTDTNTDPNKAGSITGGSDGIVQEKGTLTVEGKTKISGNTGSGIVQNNGTMEIQGDTEISDNGTGIKQNNGTMTVFGNTEISGNGTGIEQNNGGSMGINDNVSISGNTTGIRQNGGSVGINDNVSISGNTTGIEQINGAMTLRGNSGVTGNGTGVDHKDGELTLEGSADISGNTDNDLYLHNGEITHVSDGFDGDVYVSTEKEPTRNNPVKITDNPKAVNSLKTKGEFCFYKETVSTDPFTEVVMMGVAVAQRNYEDNGKQVTKNYGKLQDALDEAESGETVKLINDPYQDLEADVLVIGKDKDGRAKDLTLDLNGEFITGKDDRETSITVNDGSKLTITDNSKPDEKDGKKYVGGVYGKLSTGTEPKDENSAIVLRDGLYGGMEREDYLPFIPGSYSLVENTDELTGELYPFKVLYTPKDPDPEPVYAPAVKVEPVDVSSLSEAQQTALADLTANGTQELVNILKASLEGVTANDNGSYTVIIKAELLKGADTSKVHVWFVNEDGTLMEVGFTVDANGNIVVLSGRLGIYFVTVDSTVVETIEKA